MTFTQRCPKGAIPNLNDLHRLSTTGKPPRLFKPNILFNSYIKHSLTQTGDIEQNHGPIENPCHICNNEVKTQHELQCENCETWLHSNCLKVNHQELETFETHNIPFMCPRSEWDANDQNDIEFDVLNGSDRCSNISIEIDSQPIIDSHCPRFIFCSYQYM